MRNVLRLVPVALVALAFCGSTAQAQWGDLKITFTTDQPLALPALNTAQSNDPFCRGKPVPDDSIRVDPATKGVADVLVWLSSKPKAVHPMYAQAAAAPLTLDNAQCRFEPHVLFVMKGQKLTIKNSDQTGHNTKIDPFDSPGINPLIPAGGTFEHTFAAPESLPVKASCSIHAWMASYLLIQDHPYAGASSAQGVLEIKGLPAGKQELKVWHEPAYLKKVTIDGKPTELKKGRLDVTIPNGGALELKVVIPMAALKS